MDSEEDVNLEADGEDADTQEGRDSGADTPSTDSEHLSFQDAEDSDESEGQDFDITLAATHSYMGESLSSVSGRVVLEAGWSGSVPVLAHHSVVFPGETVPMLLNNEHDAAMIAATLNKDKLFGLLCPDESGRVLSGYGVVCEVFEAALGAGRPSSSVTFKARAVNRFRFKDMPRCALPVALYVRVREFEVVVLPEVVLQPPLRHVRSAAACLTARRTARPPHREQALVRVVDAAVCAWPHFVYHMLDFGRMCDVIRRYFTALGLEKMLPAEPVALSFWVASNLTVSPRDRLSLLVTDNVLLRLYQECSHIAEKSVLCCAGCGSELARQDSVFAMSSCGVSSSYTNLGGYVHDIVTVRRADNTDLSGAPSLQYSWFPGYAWSIAVCSCCKSHVGWRFDGVQRTLRPRRFYGLCRNYVTPRDAARRNTPPPDAL